MDKNISESFDLISKLEDKMQELKNEIAELQAAKSCGKNTIKDLLAIIVRLKEHLTQSDYDYILMAIQFINTKFDVSEDEMIKELNLSFNYDCEKEKGIPEGYYKYILQSYLL